MDPVLPLTEKDVELLHALEAIEKRSPAENQQLQLLYLRRWLAAKLEARRIVVWQYRPSGCVRRWCCSTVADALAWIGRRRGRAGYVVEREGLVAHRHPGSLWQGVA